MVCFDVGYVLKSFFSKHIHCHEASCVVNEKSDTNQTLVPVEDSFLYPQSVTFCLLLSLRFHEHVSSVVFLFLYFIFSSTLWVLFFLRPMYLFYFRKHFPFISLVIPSSPLPFLIYWMK